MKNTIKNIGLKEERAFFIENLAILLDSDMDIVSAITAMDSDIKNKRMKQILHTLKTEINMGIPIWESLNHTELLSRNITSLIRIGEESGNLTENLKLIVEQQQKDREFSSKIHSAMMYPVLILAITLIVGIGISWFILPRLTMVFARLKIELPLITKIMLAVGKTLGEHGSIIVPSLLFGLLTLFFFVFIFSKTKGIGQWILMHIPGVNKLIREIETARMTFILGTLLRSGVPIVDALQSLTRIASFKCYKKLYTHLKNEIEEGKTFRIAFTNYKKAEKLMPNTVQNMIFMAEHSGSLEKIFLKIGTIFETKTESTMKNLMVVLEPILLIVIWLCVVGVALAVILPVYSLVGGFKTS